MAQPEDILLLNLTRLGDLVQCTPLAVGLKRRNPAARIVVGAVDAFLPAARLMDGVDEVIPIDYDGLVRLSRVRASSVVSMVAGAEALLSPLLSRRFSRAVNLTHTAISAFLMYLVKSHDKRGIQMNATGNRIIRHPWMLFFHNFALNKQISPFNLVDMYALGGGCPIHEERVPLSVRIPPEAERWAEEFVERELPGRGPVVAVQAGASDAHKMWHPSSFIRLCRILRDAAGARFLFIGGKGERDLSERICAVVEAPGSAVAAGRTDLPQLCALLRRADLMVTNDTGPMHLAAAVGTPVASIALGPVYYSNTGPYGEGHVVFQPSASCAPCSFNVRCVNPECKNMVTPEGVALVVLRMLRGEALQEGSVPDGPEFAGCEVYVSGRGDDGLMDYLPLLSRRPTPRWHLARAYRRMWSDVLLSGEVPPGAEMPVPAVGNGLIPPLRRIEALAEDGKRAAGEILGRSRKAGEHLPFLKARLETIREVSSSIRELGLGKPEVNSLCQMFAFEEENMEEGDLRDAARENVSLFNNLLCRTRSLAYLLSEGHAGKTVGEKGEPADAVASRR
ncbi:MAG: glycosyltransferase family 9 protein [Candidatus Deferrimicrobiaceae bacterium]